VTPVIDASTPLTNHGPEARDDSFSGEGRIELEGGKEHVTIGRSFPECIPDFQHLALGQLIEGKALSDAPSQIGESNAEMLKL
jgi:hypothetical protein